MLEIKTKAFNVPPNIKELSEIFRKNNFSLFLVGGAVRDWLLGIKNHDYDFTTDAKPDEVKSLFKHTIDTGVKHGTVTVLYKGGSYEITTFRTESDYSDMRHPDKVEFVTSLDEDLRRRDFTINALAINLADGKLIDKDNKTSDLENGLIRAIGDPDERFKEDALRMLRACRFSSKLNFEIEKNTLKAIIRLKENISFVSAERIREELFKLIDSPSPRRGLNYMKETGLMKIILPELEATSGVMQLGYHNEDVYEHSIMALEYAAKHNFPLEVKLACLFHDIGKPETQKMGNGRYTFYTHEAVGAKMTENILRRLKASNKEIEDVSHLVGEHMFNYTPLWTDAAVRRFINRVGLDYIDRLFMLRDADREATTNLKASQDNSELRLRVNNQKKNALSLKDLKINGNDLKKLGITDGKKIGKTLNRLLSLVIDEPTLNDYATLSELALQDDYDVTLQEQS